MLRVTAATSYLEFWAFMDPKEWQRLADEIGVDVTHRLDQLESEFWPEPSDPSFRTFWPRIRELSELLRTAPAIDIEVKLALLGRIRQLTKQARHEHEAFYAEHRHRKQEALERLEELRSEALAAREPAQVRRLRQDIASMRETVTALELPTRQERQVVWETWQTATQEVWDHLRQLWNGNQVRLAEVLDDARSRLDRGDVRATRELIRRFNTELKDLEVSHQSARALRGRARLLWREAADVAQAKHEAFIATAGDRVERWKDVKGRNSKAISRIRAEISELEHAGQATGVAAAFTKAMIDEKVRELERLEESMETLDERIDRAESALQTVG